MSVMTIYIWPKEEQFDLYAQRFADSYAQHNAGANHDLFVIIKEGGNKKAKWLGSNAKYIIYPNEGWDLGPFQHLSRIYDGYDFIFLFSTYAQILADDWLSKYMRAAWMEEVGAVGATGSYERGISDNPCNPHLRTANFLIRPEVFNNLGFNKIRTKHDCHELEHGNRSLYIRLLEQGLRCVVIDKDGNVFKSLQWSESNTFRSGEQDGLIITDNRTDHWQYADPATREVLTSMAGFS